MGKIRYAPLSIPLSRRLQTLSVLVYCVLIPLGILLFFSSLAWPALRPFTLLYLLWMIYDQAPFRGSRRSDWMRHSFVWKHFVAYYPIKLIKTVDLPPDRNYLFGQSCHGIIGMSAVANFATEATNFSVLFPGIIPHLLTLRNNFYIPLHRDVITSLGICDVSAETCRAIWRKGKGNSVTILVGGAEEALLARPGTNDVILLRRLGFIKLAIRAGADIVPCFAFGENNIFEQFPNEKGTWLFFMQSKCQQVFGFTIPIFFGRGVFNYNFGLLPYRRPIVTVVGRPIRVTQNDSPTLAEMKAISAEYVTELTRIWDEGKDLYAKDRIRDLRFVE